MKRVIGILGGTFDPVHHGHLRSALDVMQAVGLDEVRFIPANRPPHRAQPMATAQQRLAMVRAAVADQQGFMVDDREIRRSGPSFTVETLTSLRADCPDCSLCLLVGDDAFAAFSTWHQWREIPKLAHLVIMRRAATDGPAEGEWDPDVQDYLRAPGSRPADSLRQYSGGCVLFHRVTQLEISATAIRNMLAAGESPRYLLPDSVLRIIRAESIYNSA